MPPRRRRSTASSAHARTPRRTPRRRPAPEGTPPPPGTVTTPVEEATTRTAEVQTTPLVFEEEEVGDPPNPPLQTTLPRTTPTSGNVEEEVLQIRAAMREMQEMMRVLVQERNTSKNSGERGEAHHVISEGYASSDFDSVHSGELPFEENVRPTRENVGMNLLNSSAHAPAGVRVQFSDGMAHGSVDPPRRGNQTGREFDDPASQHHPDSDRRPLNQNYKERVRRECHKLAVKSEIFTGKSSQEITIASVHRDIEETAEDHGWDELSVGSYYLLRYRLSRSVWDNVIDSIGKSFDRSCAAGFKARVEAIWRVLEHTYSNAVVRDKLKTQWKQLRRNPAESCRDFISRVQNARKELQYSGALVEDSDEISIWRNGLFGPYNDWVGQYLAVAAVEGHPYGPRSIQQLRAEIQIRGDEYEDRHGIVAVPSTSTSLSAGPPGSSEQGGLYTATQQQSQTRQDQPISKPTGCQRCYAEDHTVAECKAAKPAKCESRCRHCGLSHEYIPGWDPKNSRCSNRFVATSTCRLCSKIGHFARICMKGRSNCTSNDKTALDGKVQDTKAQAIDKDAGQALAVSLPNDQTAGIRYVTLIFRSPGSGEIRLRAMIDSGSSESFLSRQKYDELRQAGIIDQISSQGKGMPVEFGNGGVSTLIGRAKSKNCYLEDGTYLPIEWGILETLSPCSAVLSMKPLRERGAVWIISRSGDRLYVGQDKNLLPSSSAVYAPGMHTSRAIMNVITTAPPQTLLDELSGVRNFDETSPYDDLYDEDKAGSDSPQNDHCHTAGLHGGKRASLDAPLAVSIGPPDESAPRGRVQVQIPWKDITRPPRSFAQAWHRDRALRQRLESSPEKLQMFRTQVDQLVQQGFAEELPKDLPRYPPDESDPALQDRHYISLVPVYSATRHTKCRLCLDARTCNTYTRPGWHNPQALLQAFVGWRAYVWVGLFDLSKAFWRINIVPQDRKWTCCVADSRRLRFTALPFGFNFSPCTLLEGEDLVKEEIDKLIRVGHETSLLGTDGPTTLESEPDDTKEVSEPDSSSTIVDIEIDVNHETPEPSRSKSLRCKFYVDDGQVRENHSPSAGAKKLMWARWGFAQYGFPSEGVKTSGNFHVSREVIAGLWEGQRRAKALDQLRKADQHSWKSFLGYLWDPEVDAIAQVFPELQSNEQIALSEGQCLSRREVISIVQRWHDPLGLFNEVGGFSKCLIRMSVQNTKDWDNLVQETTMNELRQWVLAMQMPIHVTPRYCDLRSVYVFSDASTTCWCAEIRDVNLHLVYSRSGLFKAGSDHTIPRKETEAAYQAVITLEKLLSAFPQDDPEVSRDATNVAGFYTDSEILIHRLRGGDRIYKGLSAAERRRIKVIEQCLTENETKIQHIPGTVNPSDRGSRPENYKQYLQPPELEELRHWLDAEAADPSSLTFDPKEKKTRDRDDSDLFDPNDFPLVPLELPTCEQAGRASCCPMTTADLLQLQLNDNWCSCTREVIGRNDAPKWARDFFIDDNDLICRRSPVYVQQNEAIASHPVVIPCTAATLQTRTQLATEAHRAAAHPGGVRTTNVVKRNYWWKRMQKVCAKVVAECECCQRSRANRTWRRAASVVKWRSNLNPGELVGIDVMYLPPLEVEGCRFVGIISATCISTKWLRAVPITGFSGQQAAEALDRLFYNTVIPRVLIVDQGSNFIAADTFRSWAAKRQIRLKYFPVASSSLAGWVERPHKGLRDHLRPMLLDKEDPSLVGDNNWMTRLPRAVYAWNAASYSSNSVLSPYMMVYGIPPRIPGAELTTDDEELAQLGIDHLIDIPSWTALLQQMNDLRRITRDVTMKEYIALWCDLRDKARSSLTRRTKTTEVIRVGDFVRILRPKQPASECTIVVSVRGSVIRIVDSSHRVSDEYIGNIVLAKNDPSNKDILLECKKSYDRDGSFPDLPAIAVTRELQQSEIADGSLRMKNLIEKLSTLPVCSPDNLTIDSTVVILCNIDGRPTTSFWRVSSRDQHSDVWNLSEANSAGELLNDGRTLSVTRNNGFFDSMPTLCCYRVRLPMTRDAESRLYEARNLVTVFGSSDCFRF